MRSCEHHMVCGSVVKEDSVVRLKLVQLAQEVDEANPEVESTAIAVYLVSGSVDTCRLGFATRNLIKYKDKYNGRGLPRLLKCTMQTPRVHPIGPTRTKDVHKQS